mmetsp:Transcript_29461/g.63847  ORF Transcript_29461/g.63847 Transcript_29461/m.63847 type:complete len:113 (+) Transcript_29461:549-887(+)
MEAKDIARKRAREPPGFSKRSQRSEIGEQIGKDRPTSKTSDSLESKCALVCVRIFVVRGKAPSERQTLKADAWARPRFSDLSGVAVVKNLREISQTDARHRPQDGRHAASAG